ncbi:uncharacterized protein LOC119577703 [Penaeus monodon]|uniref:uncharacterized protein LOC119577703 n=1 Tax=Penaeus monodon TaxID=6687 RepID=UPI0018A792E1|nr:uncharacterized protein LOC119577703 [Penaeus monodon]
MQVRMSCWWTKKMKRTSKYFGFHKSLDGAMDQEISHRIQSGWRNWKNVSGVLCENTISVRMKGTLYRTAVRPAMVCGAEAWPIKKNQERLHVAEMCMFMWVGVVERIDRISNDIMR